MSLIVGIDLGTTNSLIGAMDAGFPVLLADAAGERLTPSVVHFPESGEPLCGRPAVRMRALDPANTVYSVKRFIGRRAGEEADDVGYTLAGAKGAPVRIRIRDREYTPEEISALILKKLRADAARAGRSRPAHVVAFRPISARQQPADRPENGDEIHPRTPHTVHPMETLLTGSFGQGREDVRR